MLYEDYEMDISHGTLSKVIPALPAPVCLLGGWAVYYTVNTNYNVSTGTSYHGSKDIDLGFHLESDATKESLRKSTLADTIKSLRGLEFHSVGIRLHKDYHRETHLPLSEAMSKKTPSYNIFQLYVDLLVDNIPKGIKETLAFTPFDEKRLVHVFKEKMFKTIDEFPIRVILPTPPVLLAMKIASLPKRTKDHKKYKDIMDVYALIWYSGIPMKRLRLDVSRLVTRQDMREMVSSIAKSDYKQAADALGIDENRLENVINNFVGAPAMKRRKDRWALPENMSYNRLVMTVKVLLVSKADRREVEADNLAKKVGVVTNTVKRGLSFLQSVGIVESSGKNRYRLTVTGVPYAEAHMNDDTSQITQLTLNVIEQSHLNELAIVIRTNKNLTLKEIYKRIKTFGRYPDGKGPGNMHGPVATGALTVIRLFVDAGLLDKDVLVSAAKNTDGTSSVAGKASNSRDGKIRPLAGGKMTLSGKLETSTNQTDDQALLVLRGVGEVRVNDLETLELAESYMKMLRKRLSQGSSSNKAARAESS